MALFLQLLETEVDDPDAEREESDYVNNIENCENDLSWASKEPGVRLTDDMWISMGVIGV